MKIKRNTFLARFLFAVVFAITSDGGNAADKFQPSVDGQAVAQLNDLVKLRRAGETEEAIAKLDALVQAYPDYYYAHYNLGIAYADARKYPEAISALQKAEKIKKENQIVDYALNNSMGWVYLLNGDTPIAEKYLTEAIEDAEKVGSTARGRLYNNYAQLKISKGEYEGAEEYLVKSSKEGNQLATKTLQTLKSVKE